MPKSRRLIATGLDAIGAQGCKSFVAVSWSHTILTYERFMSSSMIGMNPGQLLISVHFG
jgi:hypothetical protein